MSSEWGKHYKNNYQLIDNHPSREEADERIARELAEKLEREAELERRRLLRKSEQIARSLQQEQMQKNGQSIITNELPIPPRNSNQRIGLNGGPPPPVLSSSAATRSNNHNMFSDPPPPPPPEPIHPTKPLELTYASLDLPHNQHPSHSRSPNSAALYDTIFNVIEDPAARRNLLLKHTPEKAVPYNVSLASSQITEISDSPPPPPLPPPTHHHGGAKQKQQRPQKYSDELAIDVDLQNRNYQKLSPAKFDILMGNEGSSAHARGSSYDSAEDATVSELEKLRILGVPQEELQEMGRRARQERIDADLARRLQEQLAHDEMSQEEKDRILALEAQDKELARMLQERERAKAKRAKERARLKKLQREQERQQAEEEEGVVREERHADVEEDSRMLNESYANPRDLVVGSQQQRTRDEDGAVGEG